MIYTDNTANSKTPLPTMPMKKAPLTEAECQNAIDMQCSSKQADAGKYDSFSLSHYDSDSSLIQYLQKKYHVFSKGMVSVSSSYLKSCLDDPEKLSELESMLQAADTSYDKLKNSMKPGETLKSFQVSIDSEGKMSMKSHSTKVGFNAAKRAAELAGASTTSDLSILIAKLQSDLSELKAGGADEETIAQVKRMIKKAELKMKELREKEQKNDKNHVPAAIYTSQGTIDSASLNFSQPVSGSSALEGGIKV